MKLYRLIFVGKAFILLVSIFLINHGITIGKILNVCGVTCITIDLPDAISYAIYIGLSINNIPTLVFAYIALTILCYCAEIYLYNPIFHLLGYRFYFVTADKNKVLVMTKKDIKLGEPIEFMKLGQVNDFTYIDIEETSKESEE